MTVPARSEIITEVALTLNEDSVIFNKEISKGIFVASSIVNKTTPLIKLINTSDRSVVINNLNLDYEPLSSFEFKLNEKIVNSEDKIRK